MGARYLIVTISAVLLGAALARHGIGERASAPTWGQAGWEERLPPLPAEGERPPLREASSRSASYEIEARLDPDAHTITGTLVLTWNNTSGQALDRFPFHLYWNAFLNSKSTAARGEGRRAPRPRGDHEGLRDYGYTEVRAVRLLEQSANPVHRFQDLSLAITEAPSESVCLHHLLWVRR